MEYQYIVNPATNRKCRVDSVQGKKVIKNYMKVQSGGDIYRVCQGLKKLTDMDMNKQPTFKIKLYGMELDVPLISLECGENNTINIKYSLEGKHMGTIKKGMFGGLQFKGKVAHKGSIKSFRYQDKSGKFFTVKNIEHF